MYISVKSVRNGYIVDALLTAHTSVHHDVEGAVEAVRELLETETVAVEKDEKSKPEESPIQGGCDGQDKGCAGEGAEDCGS